MSLAMHMIASGEFRDKQILLVDKDLKRSNDRTWCFWEKDKGLFEDIVYRQWQRLWFHGSDFSSKLDIAPYRYKMIRGIDFYNHCLKKIQAQSNFRIIYETVDEVMSADRAAVMINGEKLTAEFVFNSILPKKPELNKKQYWLLQHFKG